MGVCNSSESAEGLVEGLSTTDTSYILEAYCHIGCLIEVPIAIPPLGSGNGGLDWIKVKQILENHLKNVDCDIQIYEPNAKINGSWSIG